MEELDSSSHIVRIFQHEANDRESGLLDVDMAVNNTAHTRLRGDWNPSGKCYDLLHEGLTPSK